MGVVQERKLCYYLCLFIFPALSSRLVLCQTLVNVRDKKQFALGIWCQVGVSTFLPNMPNIQALTIHDFVRQLQKPFSFIEIWVESKLKYTKNSWKPLAPFLVVTTMHNKVVWRKMFGNMLKVVVTVANKLLYQNFFDVHHNAFLKFSIFIFTETRSSSFCERSLNVTKK